MKTKPSHCIADKVENGGRDRRAPTTVEVRAADKGVVSGVQMWVKCLNLRVPKGQ